MKRITVVLSIILIILFGVILFFLQDIVKYFNKENNKISNNILTNSSKINSIFLDNLSYLNKLGKDNFAKGFWCQENNSVRYYDMNVLLNEGWDKKDIQAELDRIFKKCNLVKKENIKILDESKLNDDEKFNNELYRSSILENNNYLKIKLALEQKTPKKAIDYFRLSEIYSFEGEYKKSNQYLNKACKLDKKYCLKNNVLVKGSVVDLNKNPLKSVKVTLLSTGSFVYTNSEGEFNIRVPMVKLKKERLSFEKDGYSPTFVGITNISELQKSIKIDTVQMNNSQNFYTLDLKNNKVNNDGIFDGKNFILKTNKSKYIIPKDAFVDGAGKKYYGIVKAYLFEFDENTVPESLIELDNFGQDGNLLGSSMTTYGMPYISFRDLKGNKLNILSEKPMILINYNEDIDRMLRSPYNNSRKKDILNQSKKGKMYYTLENINKTQVPLYPFWVLDQTTGVWKNVGYDIIKSEDNKYLIKTIFYTKK